MARPAQLLLGLPQRGGPRHGAGRPPKGPRALVSHDARPRFTKPTPVHVSVRVAERVWNLRSGRCFRVIAEAFAAARGRFGLRLIEFSVLGNHLHLVVEADHNEALSRGMQGLAVRVAKAMNRLMGTRGRVLADHYDARTLDTPTQLVNAIAYVVGNATRHYGTTGADPFSSTACERAVLLCAGVSWLIRAGWRRGRGRCPRGRRACTARTLSPRVLPPERTRTGLEDHAHVLTARGSPGGEDMRAIVAIVVPATLIACQTGNARSTATLSVTVVGPGGVTSPLLAGPCRGTCAVPVSSSRSIRLEALADAGAGFAGWSGDCAGTASCDLTVSGTGAAVVATFEAPRLKLEVSLNGSGAVRSDPDGIDCPGTCSATFAPGASVRLTATAAANSEFGGFTGACSGASCSIVLSGPGSVQAVFKRRLVQVEVAVDGGGSVTSTPAGIDCPRACTASFPADSPVALTATPQEGFRFKEFAGACRGNACVVNPWFPPLQITAVFSAIPQRQLAVSLAGTGGGRVTSTPAGIDCPGKCTAPFYQGTQVKLTARPRALSRFAGWTGACVGTTCTLPVVFDTAVSGSFVPLRYALIDLGPQVASSRANGISAKGSFVVGLSSTSSGVFFWNGAMNDLGIPQDPPTDVAAVNEAGLVAGWHGVPARAFRWQSGKLTDLPSLGGGDSWVGGLNDSGVVVGSSRPPNSYSLHAVSWGPGGITDLGSLGTGGNACSVAEGINNAGVIVGYSCIDGPSFEYRAVRFRAPDVIDDLGTLGGDWASAMAVNDDGMIVGGSRTLASGVEHGFVHTDASGIVDIGVLPGMVSSYLLAVGPSGLALGESWDASGAGSAILYGEGRLLDLNDLVEGGPYAIEYARGVSDSGEIVATARFGSQLHAVLVVPR